MSVSPTLLDDLREERDQCRETALAMISAEDYDSESSALRTVEERGTYLDGQIERLVKVLDSQQASDALDGRFAKVNQRQEQHREQSQQTQTRSWGQAFVESDQFRSWNGRGTSGSFQLDFDPIQNRALPTGLSDLVAAGLTGTKLSVDTSAPAAPTPLMDAVTQIAVSGNSIEYVAWSKKAGGAAKVAEKAVKPSAEFGPVVTPATLDTFAVWSSMSRQMAEDFASVRDLINNELQRDVARAEEADAAAVLAAATGSIPDVTNASLLASIRMAIGSVQSKGYTPTGILLNPADYAALDIAVFGATASGPTVGASFWGLRPIPSTAQPAGTAVVGDMLSAVHHYYRSAIALMASDSAQDGDFIKNILTVLAERRSKTVVVRPQALVEAKTA